MPIEIARSERQALLNLLGFTPQQAAMLLEQGVTVDQLRGMWQLRQCEGAPAPLLTDLAARIDRIEKLENSPLDSLAT